jgi:hypothetical protein
LPVGEPGLLAHWALQAVAEAVRLQIMERGLPASSHVKLVEWLTSLKEVSNLLKRPVIAGEKCRYRQNRPEEVERGLGSAE